MNIKQALKLQSQGKTLALSCGLPAELKNVNGDWVLDSVPFGYGSSEILDKDANVELFKEEQQLTGE